MIVLVVDGGDIMLHHAGDDGVLVPERDKDGDGLSRGRLRPRSGYRAEAAGRRRCQPGPQADGVQSQVVQAADEDDQRQREQAGALATGVATEASPTARNATQDEKAEIT